MKNNTQGFTLIELLIVIAIIGILAAVLIPNLLGAQKRAYDTGAASCAKSLQMVQATWQIDNKTYGSVGAGTGINGGTDGVATNCKDTNMSVNQTVAGSGTTYTIQVWDMRGSKTWTITPADMTQTTFPNGTAPTKVVFPGS